MVDIDPLRDSIARKMREAQEKYLLDIFGSYENAKKVAHLYVFEEHGLEFDSEPNADGTYSLRFSYRVRPKSPEEIAAEEAAKAAREAEEAEATKPIDEVEFHEWTWVEFNYAGYLECYCGYRPQNQEEMDAHIPPVPLAPTD
jgi:hypothetical protein